MVRRSLRASFSTRQLGGSDQISFCVEILSCRRLLTADVNGGTSDPYVKVKMGKKNVHQTKPVLKNCNPVYSVKTNSTFFLKCCESDLIEAGGLRFKVKDHDKFTNNDDLGEVQVPATTILKMKGVPVEYKLAPPRNRRTEKAGYIKLRCFQTNKKDFSSWKRKSTAISSAAELMQGSIAEELETLYESTDSFNNTKTEDFFRKSSKPFKNKSVDCETDDTSTDVTLTTHMDVSLSSTSELTQSMMTEEGHDLIGDHFEHKLYLLKLLSNINPDDELRFSIEIVSCRDLLKGSQQSANPCVEVQMGPKTIHQTRSIVQTLNPKFTKETDSAFVLRCTARELFKCSGLVFSIVDRDPIVKDHDLGDVHISADYLCHMNGDVLEHKISPPKMFLDENAGFLSFSCRQASVEEIQNCESSLSMQTKLTPSLGSSPNLVASTISRVGEEDASFTAAAESHNQISLVSPNISDRLTSKENSALTKKEETITELEIGIDHSCDDVISTISDYFQDKDNCQALKKRLAEDKLSHFCDSGASFSYLDGNHDIVACQNEIDKQKLEMLSFGRKISEKFKISFEVMNGRNLLRGSKIASNPYVTVCMKNKKEILHKTKPIAETLSPEFSTEHDATFTFCCTVEEIFEANGLQLKVFDWDICGLDKYLGDVHIYAETLCEMSGKPLTYEVTPPFNRRKEYAGTLTVCVSCAQGGGMKQFHASSQDVSQDIVSGSDTQVNSEQVKINKDPDDTGKGESETKVNEVLPVTRLMFSTIPSWRLPVSLKGNRLGRSNQTKVTIHGADNIQTRELIEQAVEIEPENKCFELCSVQISSLFGDYRLARKFLETPSIENLSLIDLCITSCAGLNPPVMEALSIMPSLKELEIRMEREQVLPISFFESLFESSSVESLILWNVIFEPIHFQQLSTALSKRNRTLQRLEIWCSNATHNSSSFANLTSEILKKNTSLKTIVLSHVGLNIYDCNVISDALRNNYTLEQLALLNVPESVEEIFSRIKMESDTLQQLVTTSCHLDVQECMALREDLYKYSLKYRRSAQAKWFRLPKFF